MIRRTHSRLFAEDTPSSDPVHTIECVAAEWARFASTIVPGFIYQLETIDSGDISPNEPQNKAFLVACTELHGRIANWAGMNAKEIAALNALLSKNNLKTLPAAQISELVMPVCATA